ncbi:MAG: glycoside hydrolase family 3 C-terminal domain-containing protein [Clostridia bacterium]|nr:glycoside hydrolase family 3 C-terminal domain-containing protein [Clostridia bacterium]
MDIKGLLDKMSLKEKLYQLQQLDSNVIMYDENMPVTGILQKLELDENYIFETGSLLNSFGAKRTIEIQKNFLEHSKNKIPTVIMQDVVRGYKTLYPINLGLSCSFDMDLCEKCASMAAKEASVDGVHMTFAPMLDVSRDARWGRVMETSGEDTYLTCEIAKATTRGFQGDGKTYGLGVGCKHMAGYGAPESGKDYNLSDMSEITLREIYLPPYKASIDEGAMLVMAGQQTLNGVPCVLNSHLMKDILRDEWGFDGIVISDYNCLASTVDHGYSESHKQAVELAMQSEMNMEMATTCVVKYGEELVNEGKVSIEQIDKAVLRILKVKEKLGLFENPYRYADPNEANKILGCKEHKELARIASEESAVLLKNDCVLPFSKDVKSVALIGPLADEKQIVGSWWCAYDKNETVTVLEGIKNLLPYVKINYAMGCGLELDATDISQIDEAVELAKESDIVILCVGEDMRDSGESKSKAFLELSPAQKELIRRVTESNKNTATVLFTGRPLVLTEENKTAGAILNVFFPGTEGGNAIANLLFGNSVPCGKLTMSFPHNVGQCPVYYNHFKTGNYRTDDTKRMVFKSGYIDGPNKPLYPFGYGLSYTDFEYSSHKISSDVITDNGKITASVKVKNIGKYKAKEIVQMYIQDLFGSVVRPVKELRGFKKIELGPNEEKTVEFEITEDTLAFVGADLKRKAEKGRFRIFIGNSSEIEPFAEFEYK